MSIPADPDRDADLILSSAIDELVMLRKRIQEDFKANPYGTEDTVTSIDDEYGKSEDMSNMPALIRWVEKGRKEATERGAIFDTSFRCVSEGGSLFYFDPEILVDTLNRAKQALREAEDKLTSTHHVANDYVNGNRVVSQTNWRPLRDRIAETLAEVREALKELP